MRRSRLSILAITALLVAACGDDDGGQNVNQNGNANQNQNGNADAGVIPDGHAPDAALPDAGQQDATPGTYITPDSPGGGDVQVTVHTGQDVHAISPWIYGINAAEEDGFPDGLTLWRSGGNRWTAYNWENNASHAGTDWMNQNDAYLGGGDTPGEAVRGRVAAARAYGAASIVTVPIQPYVAADKDGGGDVNQTPDYLNVRFRQNVAEKGAAFASPPDLGDDAVYQDEFVSFLDGQFPDAHDGSAPPIFYCLDNEPDLWSSTHVRIHPDPATYAEMEDLSVTFATAIKAVSPAAIVMGPVSYGWQGMVDLQTAPDAAGRDFLEFYLEAFAAASSQAGQRLLDVLDVHWYPEAQGGGQRITVDDASPAVAEARIQAPRSLWDPTFTEDSWIAQWGTEGPIRLLPRLREKVAAAYPGTRLSISEYYYGGGDDISGGLAQADVLGIFGREDLFAATLWRLGSTEHPFIYGGFRLFVDYDGSGARFGDHSVQATTDDVEATSIYASVDAGHPERVVLVALNKTSAPVSVGLAVTHLRALHTMEVYRLSEASAVPVRQADVAITLTNALVIELPAMSASTLVLRE
jgi:hypothetical protein